MVKWKQLLYLHPLRQNVSKSSSQFKFLKFDSRFTLKKVILNQKLEILTIA